MMALRVDLGLRLAYWLDDTLSSLLQQSTFYLDDVCQGSSQVLVVERGARGSGLAQSEITV